MKEGWGPLCEFLGVEEPDKPFPHLNTAAEMRLMIVVVRVLSVAVPAALALLGIAVFGLLRKNLPQKVGGRGASWTRPRPARLAA